MSKFAILIKPWAVSVKAWWFFVEQGGLKEFWGKEWMPVEAHNIEAARRKGLRARDTVKGLCERTWPSPRKLAAHSVGWGGPTGICFNCGKGFLYDERAIKRSLKVPSRRHNFKASAARNAKAFASTKSKDGQYPI
jgi:hypothetical protein